MKRIIFILLSVMGIVSCKCNNLSMFSHKNEKLKFNGYDTISLYDPIEVPVYFDKKIINNCTDDDRLFVHFALYSDTVVNDTIKVKKIVITRIHGNKSKSYDSNLCNDDFLSQLYSKKYISYDNPMVTQLFCVALKNSN